MHPYLIIALLIMFSSHIVAQELKCNIQVVSQQVQGTNKQVFQTLQTAIYEFMNSTVWTNHVYAFDERVECNLLFNITDQISADEFKGTLQIQSRRPVFNTNYNTVMINYMDNDIHFRYVEFEPLQFDETQHLSNLTSILAFYAYIILGFDYDSFSFEGGTPYFQRAENIVNNAQNAREVGWKAFESTSHKNRYWLINDILDDKYAPIREFNYRYHRHGLDLMDEKVVEGRAAIAESLENLQKVYRDKPDPFMQILKVILDAKADEFVNIFSESFVEEKNRVVTILQEIDPSNQPKYQRILSAG
ncbi:MAG: hypothetical protein AMS27_09315 [Bacteroides sp. SM23_62_1]|nr:MAG: hypothetical protein AMS27_09315 [Bacteroides sp. SM23_62_1]